MKLSLAVALLLATSKTAEASKVKSQS